MIRIFANKRVAFRNKETGKIISVLPKEIASLPDWIKKDPMYSWAIQAGDIKFVDNAPVVPVVDKQPTAIGEAAEPEKKRKRK